MMSPFILYAYARPWCSQVLLEGASAITSLVRICKTTANEESDFITFCRFFDGTQTCRNVILCL